MNWWTRFAVPKTIRLKTSIMFAVSRALSFFIDYVRHGFLKNKNNPLKLFPFWSSEYCPKMEDNSRTLGKGKAQAESVQVFFKSIYWCSIYSWYTWWCKWTYDQNEAFFGCNESCWNYCKNATSVTKGMTILTL